LSTTEAYLGVLDGHPQREPPGESFRYNNGGFVVLALLAERAAGSTFDRLVDDRVCGPAGLVSTGFVRGDELPADAAVGYLEGGGLRTNVLHLPVVGSGDGGIFSSADDIARLWRAWSGGDIVPVELRDMMWRPRSVVPDERMRYGLGCWVHATTPTVSLVGMDAGVSFRSVHDPERDITHTVLANTSSGAWPITKAIDEALGLGGIPSEP
jgi:CubicO group peptidase (beta-lactamase class C family)